MSSRALQKKNPKQKPNNRKQPQSNPGFFSGVSKIAGGTMLGVTMLASSVVAGGLVGLAISFRNLPDGHDE